MQLLVAFVSRDASGANNRISSVLRQKFPAIYTVI